MAATAPFGAGLTTPPESGTAGIPADEASAPSGDPRSVIWAGSGDPRPTWSAATGVSPAAPPQPPDDTEATSWGEALALWVPDEEETAAGAAGEAHGIATPPPFRHWAH